MVEWVQLVGADIELPLGAGGIGVMRTVDEPTRAGLQAKGMKKICRKGGVPQAALDNKKALAARGDEGREDRMGPLGVERAAGRLGTV